MNDLFIYLFVYLFSVSAFSKYVCNCNYQCQNEIKNCYIKKKSCVNFKSHARVLKIIPQ